MFITLTNASELHKGNKISINIDLISTVYNIPNFDKDGEITGYTTYIFCPPHGTWEVQEPLDEVVAELNNYRWNKK